MRIRQESLFPPITKPSIAHGGEHTLGKRKTRRPFDHKQALHLVLKSSKARGTWSMLDPNHARNIHSYAYTLANRWGVRIYRYANVGNHLHLHIRARSRAVFQRFLRELAGAIPIIVTGAKKSAALAQNAQKRGFWDTLAFSRIVHFGKDHDGVLEYFAINLFEAAGISIRKLLTSGLELRTIRGDPAPA